VLVSQRVKGPPGNWSLQPEVITSGGGGNEAVEAFDGKDRNGDSASKQAVT